MLFQEKYACQHGDHGGDIGEDQTSGHIQHIQRLVQQQEGTDAGYAGEVKNADPEGAAGQRGDPQLPAGADPQDRHDNKGSGAYGEHHIGALKGGVGLGDAAAVDAEHGSGEHRTQQEQEALPLEAAEIIHHGHHNDTGYRQQGEKRLGSCGLLAQHHGTQRHTGNGNQGDEGSGEGRGAELDAVALADEIDYRLQKPQNQQRLQILAFQIALHQPRQLQHRHQCEGHGEPCRQQDEGLGNGHCQFGKQKAEAENGVAHKGHQHVQLFALAFHRDTAFCLDRIYFEHYSMAYRELTSYEIGSSRKEAEIKSG